MQRSVWVDLTNWQVSGGLFRHEDVDAVVLLLANDYDQAEEEPVVRPNGWELLAVPRIGRVTGVVGAAFVDQAHHIVSSQTEFGQVRDPLGLQGFLVCVCWRLKSATCDLSGDDKSKPGSP